MKEMRDHALLRHVWNRACTCIPSRKLSFLIAPKVGLKNYSPSRFPWREHIECPRTTFPGKAIAEVGFPRHPLLPWSVLPRSDMLSPPIRPRDISLSRSWSWHTGSPPPLNQVKHHSSAALKCPNSVQPGCICCDRVGNTLDVP